MQVEVNEDNIIKYELHKVTGNTVKDLMDSAKRAKEQGYILQVQIPDNTIRHNVFDTNLAPAPVEDDKREKITVEQIPNAELE